MSDGDHAPWRVAAMPTDERVLHVHLGTPEEPQTSLCESLALLGAYTRIDWPSVPKEALREAILAKAQALKPTLVFMQLQRAGVVEPETIDQVREHLDPRGVVVHWTGDIGGQLGPGHGYSRLSDSCDLMLFSCNDHVRWWREQGGVLHADYLQIGYDEDRYFLGPDAMYGGDYDVSFLAQRYDGASFKLAIGTEEGGLRVAVGELLRKRYGKRAGVFGHGWPNGHVKPAKSGGVYRRSHLAVSVSLCSDLDRYSSDRLLRILASGTPAVVKRFKGMASWGLHDNVNCLVFDEVEELKDLLPAWLSRNNADRRRLIGRAGASLAFEHHSWPVRMAELMALVAHARGEETEVWRPW